MGFLLQAKVNENVGNMPETGPKAKGESRLKQLKSADFQHFEGYGIADRVFLKLHPEYAGGLKKPEPEAFAEPERRKKFREVPNAEVWKLIYGK